MFSLSLVRRSFSGLSVIALLSLAISSSSVFAQEQQQQQQQQQQDEQIQPIKLNLQNQPDMLVSQPVYSEHPFTIGRLARQVLLDPTTYAPSVLAYTSTKLDWDTSQVFFRNGYVEDNPRFTATGLAHDTPMSYSAGNRKILGDSLAILGGSLVNNVTDRLFEQYLLEKYPDHRKLVKALGWVERVSFASYWSYRLSAAHWSQWQWNQRNAAQLDLH